MPKVQIYAECWDPILGRAGSIFFLIGYAFKQMPFIFKLKFLLKISNYIKNINLKIWVDNRLCYETYLIPQLSENKAKIQRNHVFLKRNYAVQCTLWPHTQKHLNVTFSTFFIYGQLNI